MHRSRRSSEVRLALALPVVVVAASAVLAAPASRDGADCGSREMATPVPWRGPCQVREASLTRLAPQVRTERGPGPRVIEIVARRFAFEPAEIQVAVGEPVRLQVHSADGVHGIEIKKLKINKDIPRGGAVVTIDFTAKDPGRFPIMCSEYCGEDHENMQGMLVVVAPGEAETK